MVIFAIEIENDIKAIQEINKINKRLRSYDNYNVAISGGAYIYANNGHWYGVFNIKPIFPRAIPLYATAFLLLLAYFVRGFSISGWLVPPLIFFIVSFLWDKYFLSWLLRLGLRKAGYKGNIRLLGTMETLELLVRHY